MRPDIPFATQERPDTGLTNVRLAVWLAIAGQTMLVGGLVSGYVLLLDTASAIPRAPLVAWPWVALLSTLILIASGAAASWAVRASPSSHGVLPLIATGGLGVLFAGLRALDLREQWVMGRTALSDPVLASYYAMVGVQLAAMLIAVVFLVRGLRRVAAAEVPARIESIRATALYWHFLVGTWLVMHGALWILA
ncbi:MAG: heme-copper oxidase subunit III [Vicinamibacterales bacterium]